MVMNSASRKLTTFVCGLLAALLCLGGGTVITGVNAAESAFAYTSAPSGIDDDYEIIDNGGESTVMASGKLNFENIKDENRPVMIMGKTELTAPYTIEVSAFSDCQGWTNDGIFTIGGTACASPDEIEYKGGLMLVRSVGALALVGSVVKEGEPNEVRIYAADGTTDVTGTNFCSDNIGYLNAAEVIWKFEVQENGHINVYYDFVTAANPVTVVRNIIKPKDGSDLEETQAGLFGFAPNHDGRDGNSRTISYIQLNEDKSVFNKIDETKWEVVGDKSKAVIRSGFDFIDFNNSTVANKAYFTTEGLVNDKDVVFDVTFLSSRRHAGCWPKWGLAFGMENMNDDILAADRYQLDYLYGNVYKGDVKCDKPNGIADETQIWNTNADVWIRLVAYKDGTLEEYRGIGAAGADIKDVYATYSGLDFNGYIAFYTRAGGDSSATDTCSFKFIDVKGNAVMADINTVVGASIRIKEPTGLRFETRINKAAYDALVETYGAENVKTGTIILPADYIDAEFKSGDAFDIEAYIAAKTADTDYKDVKNQLGFYNESTAAADGYYQYFGSLVNIRTENLDRDFFGIGYISITKGDATVTIYGGNSLTAHSRNISAVATLAVNDRSTTETEKYCNKIGENDYSPYTAEVLEMLNGFIVA